MTLHSCFALAFTDPLACQGDLAGGKGANLALLTQKGFPVPSGFIVTAGAYREFVRHTGAVLDRVGTFHVDDPALLRQEAAHLRRELESLPLPAEVDQAESSAKMEHGVLTLSLAKRGATKATQLTVS